MEPDILFLRQRLLGALIGLSRATEGNERLIVRSTNQVILDGLAAPDDDEMLRQLLQRAREEKRCLIPDCYACATPCGRNEDYDMCKLETAVPEIRNVKETLLAAMQKFVRINCQAADDPAQMDVLYLGLYAIGRDDWDTDVFQSILEKLTVPDAD